MNDNIFSNCKFKSISLFKQHVRAFDILKSQKFNEQKALNLKSNFRYVEATIFCVETKKQVYVQLIDICKYLYENTKDDHDYSEPNSISFHNDLIASSIDYKNKLARLNELTHDEIEKKTKDEIARFHYLQNECNFNYHYEYIMKSPEQRKNKVQEILQLLKLTEVEELKAMCYYRLAGLQKSDPNKSKRTYFRAAHHSHNATLRKYAYLNSAALFETREAKLYHECQSALQQMNKI